MQRWFGSGAKIAEIIGLTADKIAQGETILGVEGTLTPGGGHASIKRFNSIEEMNADTDVQAGDIALIYGEQIGLPSAETSFSSWSIPETIICSMPVEIEYYSFGLTSEDRDIWFMSQYLSSERFTLSFEIYSNIYQGEVTIGYTSTDGITYTRSGLEERKWSEDAPNIIDEEANIITLPEGYSIKFRSDSYDEHFAQFFKTKVILYGGIYKAGEDLVYNTLSLPVGLNSPSQLLPGVTAVGNDSTIITGDGSIYNNLDTERVLKAMFRIPTRTVGDETFDSLYPRSEYLYYGEGDLNLKYLKKTTNNPDAYTVGMLHEINSLTFSGVPNSLFYLKSYYSEKYEKYLILFQETEDGNPHAQLYDKTLQLLQDVTISGGYKYRGEYSERYSFQANEEGAVCVFTHPDTKKLVRVMSIGYATNKIIDLGEINAPSSFSPKYSAVNITPILNNYVAIAVKYVNDLGYRKTGTQYASIVVVDIAQGIMTPVISSDTYIDSGYRGNFGHLLLAYINDTRYDIIARTHDETSNLSGQAQLHVYATYTTTSHTVQINNRTQSTSVSITQQQGAFASRFNTSDDDYIYDYITGIASPKKYSSGTVNYTTPLDSTIHHGASYQYFSDNRTIIANAMSTKILYLNENPNFNLNKTAKTITYDFIWIPMWDDYYNLRMYDEEEMFEEHGRLHADITCFNPRTMMISCMCSQAENYSEAKRFAYHIDFYEEIDSNLENYDLLASGIEDDLDIYYPIVLKNPIK